MPWFYYSGTVSRSIPVKKGLSVAVRPHSRVEIFDAQAREVQSLIKKGQLKRTGKPAGVESTINAETVTGKDIESVTPRSAIADSFAEKGISTGPDKPPKKLKGAPEMTSAEVGLAEGDKPVVDELKSVESKKEKQGKGKSKKRDA